MSQASSDNATSGSGTSGSGTSTSATDDTRADDADDDAESDDSVVVEEAEEPVVEPEEVIVVDDDVEPSEALDDAPVTPSEETQSSATTTPSSDDTQPEPAAAAESTSDPEPTTADSASEDSDAPSTTSTTTTYALTATSPAGVPAPAPLVRQPQTPIGVILGGPVALLDIAAKAINMLFSPDPSVPGDSPLLLGVLAFVRREVQRTFFNSTPGAVADAATTSEGLPTRITVLDNDIDPNPGDILTITDYTQAANGAVTLNPDGSFTYTPTAGFSGSDTFTYTISDDASPWHSHGLASLLNGGHSATATVTISVAAAPVNEKPTAVADIATTAEDTPAVIDVRANDTDPDGDALTVTAVGSVLHGTVVVLDGKVNYTPTADYHGTDTFTYTISDGELTGTATVTVTVTPVNDLPVATNDAVTVAGNSTGNLINVLSNDSDADADALTVTILGTPSHGGSVSVNADSTVAYTPATGFSGTETFTYTVSDGSATSVGTVTVNVTPVVVPVNTSPVAVNDSYTMPAGSTSAVVNVVANDADPDNDTLTVVGVTGAAHGTATFTGGTITYTPTTGYAGTETLTYTVSDGTATDTATLTITVPAVILPNTPPVAVNDSYTMPTGATSAVVDVVSNDTDADSDELTVVGVTGAAHGTATFTGGTITYTPTTGYAGTETLTYTVSDGTDTATATLTITVPAIVVDNHAPVVGEPAYEYTTKHNSGIISGTLDVTDEDGDDLTFAVLRLPDADVGRLAIDSETGAWQFMPTNEARLDAWQRPHEALAEFSIAVSDGHQSVEIAVSARISPAFGFDFESVDIDGAQSVVLFDTDGSVIVDNALGLSVIPPGGPVKTLLLGFRPTDAAYGPGGRLYVTDPVTHSVSVVDTGTGAVSQVVSTPNASGIAIDSDGRLFVTSAEDRTITIFGADGGVADVIEIDAIPTDVAVAEDGTMYVAEVSADRNSVRLTVRDTDGSVVGVLYETTSTPLGGYATPLGIALGPNGSIHLTDTNRGEVHFFTSDGQMVAYAGFEGMTRAVAVNTDGRVLALSATYSRLVYMTPEALDSDLEYDYTAIDPDTSAVSGEVVVLNPGNRLTFELHSAPPATLGTVTVDEATGSWLFTPSSAARAAAVYGEYDSSYDYVGDVNFVITVSDGTQVSVSVPIVGGSEGTRYGVDVIDEVGGSPTAMAVGADGHLYVANRDEKTITVIGSSGDVVNTIELDFAPVGIVSFTVDDENYIVVSNGIDNKVTVISADGGVDGPYPLISDDVAIGVFATNEDFGILGVVGDDSVSVYSDGVRVAILPDVPNPTGVAMSNEGAIYIVGVDEEGAGYLKVYDYNGIDGWETTTTLLGGSPSGIALGPHGHLYISDRSGLPRDVAIAYTFGSVRQTLELGVNGSAVAVGRDGSVYIADADTGTITVLTPPNTPPIQTPVGTVSTVEASGIENLYGVAVAPDGRVIVTGLIETFGEDVLGAVDAGGSFTKFADLSGTAVGVEIGPDGRIYVSDFQAGTVTAFDPANDFASEVIVTIPGAAGLAFDGVGNLYVTTFDIDSGSETPVSSSLHIIAPSGSTEVVALPGVSYDVQVAADGRVFVPYFVLSTESFASTEGGVLVLNTDGTTEDVDLPPGIMPAGIAIGPDGTLFITSPPSSPGNASGTLMVRYPNGGT